MIGSMNPGGKEVSSQRIQGEYYIDGFLIEILILSSCLSKS